MTRGGVVTVVGGAVGVLLLVIGLVTLVRTGIPDVTLVEPVTSVGPFTRTPLMGIIEILLGLLVIAGSAMADKGAVLAIGLIALVFGIVWMIEPAAFGELLGVGRESAVLYIVIGAVALVSGLMGRNGTIVRERRVG
jgi:hypothetical protein